MLRKPTVRMLRTNLRRFTCGPLALWNSPPFEPTDATEPLCWRACDDQSHNVTCTQAIELSRRDFPLPFNNRVPCRSGRKVGGLPIASNVAGNRYSCGPMLLLVRTDKLKNRDVCRGLPHYASGCVDDLSRSGSHRPMRDLPLGVSLASLRPTLFTG